MKTFETFMIWSTNLLCRLFDVTPGQVEAVKRKRRGPQRLEDRPDVLEA